MTTYGKHEGSGQAVRERGDDLCFYRGTIPTLDEKKCACMHAQLSRRLGPREREVLASPEKH